MLEVLYIKGGGMLRFDGQLIKNSIIDNACDRIGEDNVIINHRPDGNVLVCVIKYNADSIQEMIDYLKTEIITLNKEKL